MADLYNMLESMAVLKASDLYLNVGAAPTFKVNGELRTVTDHPLDENQVKSLIEAVLDQEQQARFAKELELDVGLQIKNGGRFRLNVYRQQGGLALVARHIKNVIPSIADLGLPDVLKDLIMAEQGLLLVVGATGSGKSTTLASMIDYRNENRQGHILTIEDPIEFVHFHKQSLISQREVGVDTHSYHSALRHALREAPDVIAIGEIRDQDTAKQALRFAETGHLCLATLHAGSANLAIDRLVNLFPPESHHRIYQDVAAHLVGIIGQRLAKGVEQPVVPVVEILINNRHIASLIERGDTHEIKDLMGREHADTCQTFDDSLFNLYVDGQINLEEAKRLADSEVDLMLRVRLDSEKQHKYIFSRIKDWRDPNAHFEKYTTIQLDPRRIDVERRPDVHLLLSNAIAGEINRKGYQVVGKNADALLRFSYGLRSKQTGDTDSLDAEIEFSEEFSRLPALESGLAIAMVDTKINKVIWKVQAIRPLGQKMPSDKEFSHDIEQLLESLPVLTQ